MRKRSHLILGGVHQQFSWCTPKSLAEIDMIDKIIKDLWAADGASVGTKADNLLHAINSLIAEAERKVELKYSMHRGRCSYEDCKLPAVMTVKTVLGLELFCHKHANYVESIEQDWERAERDWLEPPSLEGK